MVSIYFVICASNYGLSTLYNIWILVNIINENFCHGIRAMKLLGSKTLGLNVFELHFVMLANHDQNI